jgi:hypothetical protein
MSFPNAKIDTYYLVKNNTDKTLLYNDYEGSKIYVKPEEYYGINNDIEKVVGSRVNEDTISLCIFHVENGISYQREKIEQVSLDWLSPNIIVIGEGITVYDEDKSDSVNELINYDDKVDEDFLNKLKDLGLEYNMFSEVIVGHTRISYKDKNKAQLCQMIEKALEELKKKKENSEEVIKNFFEKYKK